MRTNRWAGASTIRCYFAHSLDPAACLSDSEAMLTHARLLHARALTAVRPVACGVGRNAARACAFSSGVGRTAWLRWRRPAAWGAGVALLAVIGGTPLVLAQRRAGEVEQGRVEAEDVVDDEESRLLPLKVFSGSANRPLAEEVAAQLGVTLGKADVGTFNDGEISVKLEESVRAADVYVIQPTCPPVDHNVMELLLVVRCAPCRVAR